MVRTMLSTKFRIPYGRSTIDLHLPASMRADLAISRPAEPINDVSAAIQTALAHPIGSAPLHELAKSGQRVCIVFTDITRASPDHLLVPALLAELEKAGTQ